MGSPPPRRADAQRNRERLLSAAEAAFNERGVSASLDDIAKVAGVGNATLYRHFPSRENLIESVYDQRIRTLCESAGNLAASREPGEALLTWLREVVVHITTSRTLGEAFMTAHDGPSEVEPPQIAAWHRAILQAAAPLLGAAQDAGDVRSDLDATELLAITTAVARAGSPAQADRFLDVLLDGVKPRGRPS